MTTSKRRKIAALPSSGWPAPTVRLDTEGLNYRNALIATLSAMRSLLPSDFRVIDATARMDQNYRMWEGLIDEAHLLSLSIADLAKAQQKAESASRAHRAHLESLDLAGKRIGVRRAQHVASQVGAADPEDEWDAILNADVSEFGPGGRFHGH
ncbi:hypothetical protein [Aliiruegeria lutimaris]|uniref:Uncharacterized protein n=1 Tax=Aliiruegeria lutimaris TaxID=571298 RepID=A0A1G8KIU9_9RHOB|nr:hypothetical protein [Aliiruegeria lutimaris]SDI43363.1 hypothetical protein SAMN04488026_10033 [Aliiruegeria lutimaris]